MSSNPSIDEIRQLVVDTEANIKKIEAFNVDFIYTTLNEWRYAVRHIVDMMCGLDLDENRARAVSHLKRAYFDSSDILIDCLLEKFGSLHDEYADYVSVVRNYVPDYAAKIQRIREAQKKHATVRDVDSRQEHYAELKDLCSATEQFIEELEISADDWRAEIRCLRKKDRLAFCGLAFAAISAIAGVIAILVSIF